MRWTLLLSICVAAACKARAGGESGVPGTTPTDTGCETPGVTAYADGDGDGYGDDGSAIAACTLLAGEVEVGGDCDDDDASAHPDGVEVAYDGVDQDCVGGDLVDADGDGESASVVGGADCDDGDAAVGTFAVEVACDRVDNDCDGAQPQCQVLLDDAAAGRFWGEVSGDVLGARFAVLGDVDGDGKDDFVVGAPFVGDDQHGSAYLVSGGPLGASPISAVATATFEGGFADDYLGQEVSPAGDVNGDGVADLWVLGAQDAYLYSSPFKGTIGESAHVGRVATGVGGAFWRGGHDLTGDGVEDVLGEQTIYAGPFVGKEVPLEDFGYTLSNLFCGEPGRYNAVLGDTDGDGLEDFFIGSNGSCEKVDRYGAGWLDDATNAGIHMIHEGYVPKTTITDTVFGAAGGDLDGDGYADLVGGIGTGLASEVDVLFGPFPAMIDPAKDAVARVVQDGAFPLAGTSRLRTSTGMGAGPRRAGRASGLSLPAGVRDDEPPAVRAWRDPDARRHYIQQRGAVARRDDGRPCE